MKPETIAAIEAERRRIADALQVQILEPLNVLLAQANAYEQTTRNNPQAHMALSVILQLTRQALQQARDFETGLHPTVLEALGLDAALESLVSQATRTHGLSIMLSSARLEAPMLPQVELVLYRITQQMIERAVRRDARMMSIRTRVQDNALHLTISDNGQPAHVVTGQSDLFYVIQQVEALGGAATEEPNPPHHAGLTVRFMIEPLHDLTERETQVLQWLADGLTNKEIALHLGISPRTVKFHLDNVYSKLGVSTRTEAAIYALRMGLTPPTE